MAKKKQRKKIYKIPEPKLEKVFNCPECGRKKVVEVRFNKKKRCITDYKHGRNTKQAGSVRRTNSQL